MDGTARGVVPFLLANQPSDWRINPARPGPANDNLDMALLKLMQIRVGTSALRAAPTSRPFLVCKSFLIEDWAAELRCRSRRALQYACADHLADPAEDLDRTAVVRALDGLIRRRKSNAVDMMAPCKDRLTALTFDCGSQQVNNVFII